MGCGCGAGVVVGTTSQLLPNTQQQNSQIENCEYTVEQLNSWLDKLICTKDSGLYISLGLSGLQMNKHLGNVMSALNYKSNICYFKNDLDLAADFIILINDSGKC